jgi:transcriptional regulator with AAA-type ATPase domain
MPPRRCKSKKSKIRKKSIKKRLTKAQCKKRLSNKIKTNIREFKNKVKRRGSNKLLFKSRAQAIAVSYSQVKKKYPECKRYFKNSK